MVNLKLDNQSKDANPNMGLVSSLGSKIRFFVPNGSLKVILKAKNL